MLPLVWNGTFLSYRYLVLIVPFVHKNHNKGYKGMRCRICDFSPSTEDTSYFDSIVDEGGVRLHRYMVAADICSVCHNSVKEALSEFDLENDNNNEQD